MMIYKTSGITPLQAASIQPTLNKTSAVQKGQYDRVEVSNYSKEQRFALELSSKLSQEVRVGRDDLSEVKQQVQSGEYKIDIDKLTTQIMLFGGNE